MAGTVRQQASGSFDLPVATGEAMWLFTPEGERQWVPGWDPQYPAGNPEETPGTVFVTSSEGVETIWVILALDRAEHAVTYARVTPGRHAGTVTVGCAEERPGHCTVTVRYDLTALPGAAADALDAYRPERFAEMIGAWEEAVGALLASRR